MWPAPGLNALGFNKVQPPPTAVPQDLAQGDQPLPVLFWVYWVAIALAVSVEFCMISWSADYLENGLGVPKVDAAQAVSLFLAAMIVGRLAGSRLVQRFSTRKVVMASILLAGAGFLAYWMARSALLGRLACSSPAGRR